MLCIALPARAGPPLVPLPRRSRSAIRCSAALRPPGRERQDHTDGVTAGHPAYGKAANRQSHILARQGVMEMDQGDHPVLVTGATGNTGRPTTTVAGLTGRPPRDIAQFARDYAAAFSG